MSTEKVPSPEQIKKEPQKFTPQEIEELRNFQIKMDQAVLQLGRVHLSQVKLKEQENYIKSEIQKIEKEEQELAQKYSDKYGRGSLDIETGTFIPVE